MSTPQIKRVARFQSVDEFIAHLDELKIDLPCDREVVSGAGSPLSEALDWDGLRIGNRWTIHPMEGWDGETDGRPSAFTIRRWRRFGQSGAKFIWGGEAVAVRPDGRANPNQLMIDDHTRDAIARLREVLVEEHKQVMGTTDDLVVGLQLTHSGRFCRPYRKDKLEPKILYHHPILDRKFGLDNDFPLMTDDDIKDLISHYHRAAKMAWELGYAFVDIKHCHGYLGHEFLSAYTREGPYGGSFENRTRFLREIVEGIRAEVPGLKIGVRLSAFDMVPFKPDPEESEPGKLGPGIPEDFSDCLPYQFGFGVNPQKPTEYDLDEPVRFLRLLKELNITAVNLSAGSPYYNPHIQRPALYPPSDGYQPAEDPLINCARQIQVVRELKRQCPELLLVGTGYTYLQEFLPNVAQAVVRQGWVDSVGIGRLVLSYPDLPRDVCQGRPIQKKLYCRTFSDCTTAPRKGIVSGCYPLDEYYKKSEPGTALKEAKAHMRKG